MRGGRALAQLSQQRAEINDQLAAAKRSGDVAGQIRLLKERAGNWYSVAELRQSAGKDYDTAQKASQHDEQAAAQLEATR
jgi:chorismate mutase